ncbi:MAG: hypothetical protein HZC24_02020 [Rhodocyclales bacterium]|nr:hypothetical protein [Rhodocyclales bacterium]
MRLCLLLSICCAGLAWADAAPPLSGDEKRLLQERAKALHDKAGVLRQEAEAGFAAASRACWEKFLVTSCQEDAKQVKTQRLEAARQLDRESRDIESRLRKRSYVEHQAQLAESAARHGAEAAAQAARNRQAQEEAMAAVERKRADAARRDER